MNSRRILLIIAAGVLLVSPQAYSSSYFGNTTAVPEGRPVLTDTAAPTAAPVPDFSESDAGKKFRQILCATPWTWGKAGGLPEMINFKENGKLTSPNWKSQMTYHIDDATHVTLRITRNKETTQLVFSADYKGYTTIDFDTVTPLTGAPAPNGVLPAAAANPAQASTPSSLASVAPLATQRRNSVELMTPDEIREALTAHPWSWIHTVGKPSNSTVIFTKDGKMGSLNWRGVSTYRFTDRTHLDVQLGKRTAHLVFSEYLTSFSGTDFDEFTPLVGKQMPQ